MLEFRKDLEGKRRRDLPIVALETSVIAQGLPYPDNIETALAAEAAVRREGGIPATIGVLDGAIKIGLSEAEIEHFGKASGIPKLSRADLSASVSRGATGATTVAATMICARAAGIEVFATGGIGGVHIGAKDSFDISQDLRELAETPVVVVSSGAKAILDLSKTLEVLETLGVPVAAYGQSEFPAFWSASSGLPAPMRMDSPSEIAMAHLARRDLDVPGGFLVANPIPADAEIPLEIVMPWIGSAVRDAAATGVSGKDVTPFLLKRVVEKSGGRSIAANVELIKCNAGLGTEIALALVDARGAARSAERSRNE